MIISDLQEALLQDKIWRLKRSCQCPRCDGKATMHFSEKALADLYQCPCGWSDQVSLRAMLGLDNFDRVYTEMCRRGMTKEARPVT